MLSLPSSIEISKVPTRWLPVTRRCKVCSGSSTRSSWSLPIAPWPLEASSATITHENCLMRSRSPSGSRCPSSSRATVAPTAHTAAPARCSPSSNGRPAASVQLAAVSQSALPPITLLDQLRPLATTVCPLRDSAATARMPPIWAAMASASASLKAGAPPPPPPGPWRWPGRTISRLLPRLAIWSCTAWVAPLPSVTMVITAPTPITMPSMVRKERSKLRRIERKASNNVLSSIRPPPPPSPPAGD